MKTVSIGLLGHVDAGKTSLARALSTKLSTAALDKHPESQRRGITLDIGISNYELGGYVVTIIDCPGHAAFVKSVLAGASIVQVLVVLIDATRGVQTQTIEAVGIAEALQLPVLCVINKIDSADVAKVAEIEKAAASVFGRLKLRFSVAQAVASEGIVADFNEKLLALLNDIYPVVEHEYQAAAKRPFEMLFDHCFGSKQAPIYTGTVISGRICVNDNVSISPGSGVRNGQFEAFTVKGIQSYGEKLLSAGPGSRIGVQLANGVLGLERGILCSPAALSAFRLCKCRIRLLRQYHRGIKLAERFTVAIGCVFVQAHVFPIGTEDAEPLSEERFERAKCGDFSHKREIWCYVLLEQQLTVPRDVKMIGVRTDIPGDAGKSQTRIAFAGSIECVMAEPFYELQHEVAKQYPAVHDKRPRDGFVIIKQIQKFPPQTSPIGACLLQNGQSVGTVKSQFGQGKYKAEISFQFDPEAEIFVEHRCIQSYRIE